MNLRLSFKDRVFHPVDTEVLERPQRIQGYNPPPGKDACLEGRSNPSISLHSSLTFQTFFSILFPRAASL